MIGGYEAVKEESIADNFNQQRRVMDSEGKMVFVGISNAGWTLAKKEAVGEPKSAGGWLTKC